MKLLKSKKSAYLTIVIIALALLLAALLWSIIAHAAHNKAGNPNSKSDSRGGVYETRSVLLMEAMDEVGSCTPEDTAYTWAQGVVMRSAAMQYAAMSPDLKDTYASELQYTFPNWVTGVSSPWVESYEITKVDEPGNKRCMMDICFVTATSEGPSGTYSTRICMDLQGHFWRITSIKADEELWPYIGFEATGD